MEHQLDKQMEQAGFRLRELKQFQIEKLIEASLATLGLKMQINIVSTFFRMGIF